MGLYDEPTDRATIHAEVAGSHGVVAEYSQGPARDVRAVEQAMDALSGEVARIDGLAMEVARRLRGLLPELLDEADNPKPWVHHGVPHADAVSSAALNLSNASDRLETLLRHLAF